MEESKLDRNTTPLYIFYQKLNTKNFIVVAAMSYLEAKGLMFSFNEFANITYNLNEYKLQHVLTKKLHEICKVDEEWEQIPFFVSKDNYQKLKKYIDDKSFTDIHHTKVLTNNMINKLRRKDNYDNDITSKEKYEKAIKKLPNFFTTNEFINTLKNISEDNIKIKKEIDKYLIDKSPLFKTKFIYNNNSLELYTNSKQQTDIIVKKLKNVDNNIKIDYNIYNKDFVTGANLESINNYKELNDILVNKQNTYGLHLIDTKAPFFMLNNQFCSINYNFLEDITKKEAY